MTDKSKIPRNDLGQLHGYVEIYHHGTNQIRVRGRSHNGNDTGYNEYHNGKVVEYHIL